MDVAVVLLERVLAELSITPRASEVITTRMLATSPIVAWTSLWGRPFPAVAPKEADKRRPRHANEGEQGGWKLRSGSELPDVPDTGA